MVGETSRNQLLPNLCQTPQQGRKCPTPPAAFSQPLPYCFLEMALKKCRHTLGPGNEEKVRALDTLGEIGSIHKPKRTNLP
jgi:hypothetical protein